VAAAMMAAAVVTATVTSAFTSAMVATPCPRRGAGSQPEPKDDEAY
jgi:hypothetical protein